jgi:hypothetical protein
MRFCNKLLSPGPRRRPLLSSEPTVPRAQAGWAVAQAGPLALVATIFCWWRQDDGWQRGVVARRRRLCKRAPFSHIVRYRRPTAGFAGDFALRFVLP